MPQSTASRAVYQTGDEQAVEELRKIKLGLVCFMDNDTFGSGSLVKSAWHIRLLKASMPFPSQWLALVPPNCVLFFCFSCIPLRMGYHWKCLRPPHFRIRVAQFRAFLMLLFVLPLFRTGPTRNLNFNGLIALPLGIFDGLTEVVTL